MLNQKRRDIDHAAHGFRVAVMSHADRLRGAEAGDGRAAVRGRRKKTDG
jgi:hypothetical protein